MITYEDIKTYVDEGKTSEEILATLQADFRHEKDIYATGGFQSDNLLHILSARFMVLHRTEDNTFAGPLIDYIKSIRLSLDASDIQQVSAIRLLLMTINVTNQQVFTSTDLPAAGMVELIIPIVGAVSPVADEAAVRADIYRVTGGPKYAALTTEMIDDIIQLHVDSEAARVTELIIDTAIATARQDNIDSVKPYNDKMNNIFSNLTAYDTTGKTDVEIQAFVDNVMSSEDGNPDGIGEV